VYIDISNLRPLNSCKYCHPHILPCVKSYHLVLVKYYLLLCSCLIRIYFQCTHHLQYFLWYLCILHNLAFISFHLAFISFLFTLLVLCKRTLSLTCCHFSSILFVVQTYSMPQIINICGCEGCQLGQKPVGRDAVTFLFIGTCKAFIVNKESIVLPIVIVPIIPKMGITRKFSLFYTRSTYLVVTHHFNELHTAHRSGPSLDCSSYVWLLQTLSHLQDCGWTFPFCCLIYQ
jgi:hypothetical protein